MGLPETGLAIIPGFVLHFTQLRNTDSVFDDWLLSFYLFLCLAFIFFGHFFFFFWGGGLGGCWHRNV